MGRIPCCSNSKNGLNRGAWTAQEDKLLSKYIKIHGQGHWRTLSQKAGLKRCWRSCRHRWMNYLRPDIKRGNISPDEEDLIIRLHKLLGNRWALIAGRLPGRTNNEIKNYWNTYLGKKILAEHHQITTTTTTYTNNKHQPKTGQSSSSIPGSEPKAKMGAYVVQTKTVKCSTKSFFINNPKPNRKDQIMAAGGVEPSKDDDQGNCYDINSVVQGSGTCSFMDNIALDHSFMDLKLKNNSLFLSADNYPNSYFSDIFPADHEVFPSDVNVLNSDFSDIFRPAAYNFIDTNSNESTYSKDPMISTHHDHNYDQLLFSREYDWDTDFHSFAGDRL